MPRKKKVVIEDETLDEIVSTSDDPILNGDAIEVESGNYPSLSRVKTELFSLDYSLSSRGSLGLPLRVLVELFGYTNSGKSTLSYYISGKVADESQSDLLICDLEMLDKKYVKLALAASGFKGKLRIPDLTDDKGVILPHEKVLMTTAKALLKEETGAVIWDSVGATQALAELDVLKDPKAQFGEAFMGKKAKLVSQVALALRTALMSKIKPSTAIAINHVHGIMGGRGHTTTGGERLKYLAGVRIMMWTAETFYEKEDDPDSKPLGFLVKGQVEKLRFGGRGREFTFYIVPGFGVHPGASAMFDCVSFGLAEREARVKLDGKSMGYLKADLLKYASEGRTRKFNPFVEKINEYALKVERGEIE
jgi:RecA/RadA recombinase